MKRGLAMAAVLLGGGAAVAGGPAPTGFHELAARSELVEVRKPMAQDGRLRVGSATGRVERRARGHEQGFGGAGVEHVTGERWGSYRFEVTGAEVGGTLAGECSYGRSEQRISGGALTISQPADPLRLRCDFRRDGRAAGVLHLGAPPPTGRLVQPTARVGTVEAGGVRLALTSAHRLGKRGLSVDTPVGYWIADGAETVGAVDTNGFTRARLALPRDPARRDAALMAGIAIASFWDPGDTD